MKIEFKNSSIVVLNEQHIVNIDNLRNIASFLLENEQYGDDWREEIKDLDSLIDAFEEVNPY